MLRQQPPRRFTELALISASFGAVYGTYLQYFNDGLPLDKTLLGCVAAILAFWLSSQLKETSEDDSNFRAVLIEQFCFGAGLSLLAHALVPYGLLARRTPFLVVGGSLLSAILVTLWRRFTRPDIQDRDRLLLVGFDNLTAGLLSSLRKPVCGVCGPFSGDLPPGITFLGPLQNFEQIVAETQPTDILIGVPNWDNVVSPAVLLNLRRRGIRITESSLLYEKVFSRVCCERLQPVDLILSSTLRGDSRTMAIQAVYNNLIGLTCLLLLAPVMLLFAILIRLTSGPGPVIESLACAGFQYIPFRLQRFRTTTREGLTTGVGRVLQALHLNNLPQLINVVRGDMALVGPRPVRSEFAEHLSALMPFYAQRFSVKPGLTGWAQIHLSPQEVADTRSEIEYDLFYIKESSLWLDLEILLDGLSSMKTAPAAPGGLQPEGNAA